ncbi:MAG TPA: hypothetical protein DC060_16510 [Gemmatimonadetes bacterium]|nr:hypothetical protein [Gemmatimonadota bacterium]HBD99786.1 hypothetical protein [Gemmatimonadota bacterium]HIC53861.1 hypothetical protein [Gemmatimonadota bacterium]HIN49385.1 hypothetical protein [Gemmatimonadota bacterium]
MEEHAEVVVRSDRARVAPHFVRGPLALWCGIPESRGHIDVVVVESDPRLGALARHGPRNRQTLLEVRYRRGRPVELLVENPVDRHRLRYARCPDCGSALFVPADDFSARGRRRAVDPD